jgi:GT2 family glycosyltransferase/glycogen synthase
LTVNIFVLDNGSCDDPDQIPQLYPNIHFIKNAKNIGFAAAVNKAIAMGNAPYVTLLNPDTLVTDTFFEEAFSFLEESSKIGLIGPKILDENKNIQGSARSFPTILTSLFGRNSPLTKMFPNNAISRSNILTITNDGFTPMSVDWVSGACMIVRRKVIEEVGMLDERFFIYWEDADWCWRIRQAGWQVVYYPKAVIFHSIGQSSSTNPIYAIYHFHRSSFYLFKKYTQWPIRSLDPITLFLLAMRFFLVMLLQILEQRKRQNQIRASKIKPQRYKINQPQKTKVLRVISRLNIGGPSIHVAILLDRLNRDLFDSKLVSGFVSKYEGDMSYLLSSHKEQIVWVKALQREIHFYSDMKALWRFYKILCEFKPDIVHSHMAKAGTVSRIAVLIYNLMQHKSVKTVHTFHGNVLEGYFSRIKSFIFTDIEQVLARCTDAVIAISKSQELELIEKYKISKPEKIHIIHLGFDLVPFINSQKHKGTFREKLGLDEHTILVGIVGRLVPIKNHRLFLDMAKLFRQRNPDAKIKFVLIGDGELRSDLEKYAEHIGIGKDVIFFGWEHQVTKIYADLDILALTSLNEGTPVSIIEAMASSVPVIATDVGGVKDLLGKIVQDNTGPNGFWICERGILCKKDDMASLCHGLEYLINNKKTKKDQSIMNAKIYITENYSYDKLVQNIEHLYLSLVNK